MKSHLTLLHIQLNFADYKVALLCFITAFAVAMVSIPPVIMFVTKFRLYDEPDMRKEHSSSTPTLGGIAIIAGMFSSLCIWFPYSFSGDILTCFFSMCVLLGMGIMDDVKDLSAKYKFIVEIALAALIALSGIRITTFGGLFGITELPISAQYSFTILAIVGVTNAFNLIDGIDSLAGGLGFTSLVMLGLFLTMSGDKIFALVAFALAGAVLAFLYFNMNPAKIFMGDTGSLVLGFVISILCIRLIQINSLSAQPLLKNAPLFALAIVLIPVFDTIRVFTLRIWKGQSPFAADKTHIHHLLTYAGLSHNFTSRIICSVHAFILLAVFWIKEWKPEYILGLLLLTIAGSTVLFHHIGRLKKFFTQAEKNIEKKIEPPVFKQPPEFS